MDMLEDTKNDEMLAAAAFFSSPTGGAVVPHQVSTPAPSAVFSEPIVTAMPCQVKRNIPEFMQRIKVLAQMAGEDYCYRWPVKNKNGTTSIVEGPTINLALDLWREYMNSMVDVRVTSDATHDIFYARFIDYENGSALTRAYKQRKSQKTMNTDKERQEDITFQIGQSKAMRNVVVNALRTFADFMHREAKNSLVEQIGKNLENWRNKMQRGFTEKGYNQQRIEQYIGKPLNEWLAPDIARVIAELKSIADGMASFDDVYPDPTKVNDAGDLNKEFIKEETPSNTPEPKGEKEEKQPKPPASPKKETAAAKAESSTVTTSPAAQTPASSTAPDAGATGNTNPAPSQTAKPANPQQPADGDAPLAMPSFLTIGKEVDAMVAKIKEGAAKGEEIPGIFVANGGGDLIGRIDDLKDDSMRVALKQKLVSAGIGV